jgi:resuscitation-promoting factor RpfB
MKPVALSVLLFVAGACAAQDSLDATTNTAPASTPTEAPSMSPEPSPEPEPLTFEVRKVVGKSIGRAEALLDRKGLVVATSGRLSHLPAGTVLRQSPRSGTHVEQGTLIELVVAKAFPRIPGVVGRGLGGARSILKAAGFEIRVIREVSSQPTGTVIEQSPAAASEVRPGRVVTLTLAKPAPAPPPTNCTPGYSPCLTPASDYDCAGGSGNGPEYAYVTVTVTGYDPRRRRRRRRPRLRVGSARL